MTRKQRIVNQATGKEVDLIPMLGGWNLGVSNVARLGGMSVEQYLDDPLAGVMRANRALDVDGMVPPIVPRDVNSIRDGQLEQERFAGVEPEALQQRGLVVPDSEREVLAKFDAAGAEMQYRERFETLLRQLGDITLIPNLWETVADFSLYFQYGYEAFLAATALYPDEVEKIWWEDSLLARERNKIIVGLFREYDLVPLMFCGQDICVNRGPMCSPQFLRQRYWPHAKRSIEPLVESGVRVVCHCDGNVMPLIDDILAAGFSGFQGFQYECGVDPCSLRRRRSTHGQVPLFFMGLSVTRTLPFGNEQEVRDEVDYMLDCTGGGQGMFLFTSNVTGVEVPPKNIVAAYRHLRAYDPRTAAPRGQRPWPWARAHPER